jgi:site-specific DNA-methyltransferase (adenine-specific)
VPSARQIVYADDRANEKGRLPDDTWILRPQDIPEAFTPQEDVWYFARVAGTFKERAGFHGCQMPERLLARIILACSREGETVLDPFSGSGTTLIVAKKLNRNYVGFELSKDYVGKVRERLSQVNVGDELEGPADPRRSAPSTGQGKRLAEKCITNTKQLPRQNVKGTSSETASQTRTIKSATLTPVRSITEDSIELRRRGIIEAFRKSCQGYSVDRVVADPELNREFLHKCNVLGIAGNPAVWNRQLFGLRKAGALKGLSTKRAIVLPTNMADQFSFASEIAWFDLAKEHGCTLDDILCDPALADQFDKYAHRLAPGFKPFHYRWAALQMRKQAKKAKEGVESFQIENSWKGMNLSNLNLDRLAGVNGAYLLRNANRKAIYVGMANDLRSVFDILQESLVADGWKDREPELVKIYPTSVSVGERMKTKASIIYREKPQIDILFSGEKI